MGEMPFKLTLLRPGSPNLSYDIKKIEISGDKATVECIQTSGIRLSQESLIWLKREIPGLSSANGFNEKEDRKGIENMTKKYFLSYLLCLLGLIWLMDKKLFPFPNGGRDISGHMMLKVQKERQQRLPRW